MRGMTDVQKSKSRGGEEELGSWTRQRERERPLRKELRKNVYSREEEEQQHKIITTQWTIGKQRQKDRERCAERKKERERENHNAEHKRGPKCQARMDPQTRRYEPL